MDDNLLIVPGLVLEIWDYRKQQKAPSFMEQRQGTMTSSPWVLISVIKENKEGETALQGRIQLATLIGWSRKNANRITFKLRTEKQGVKTRQTSEEKAPRPLKVARAGNLSKSREDQEAGRSEHRENKKVSG